VYAAAQNLVCTLTTVSFMVPLAISNAIAVKVGFANGAGNITDLKKYSFVGIVISVGFMACSALVFATFPEFLVKLFSQDEVLIKISIPILYILSIFQVFDGLQVALSGIFKGMKRTGVVLLANFIAYWLISIPLGCTLSFKYGLKLKGFWYGLCSAAIILCGIMLTMLFYNIKKLEKWK
jgi:MATE family multidrug resistance protein